MQKEKEKITILYFDEQNTLANIYTHNENLIKVLQNLSRKKPQKCILQSYHKKRKSWSFTLPKEWVQIKEF